MTNYDALRCLTPRQMAKYLHEEVFCSKYEFESEDPNERNCATCFHPQSMDACTKCVESWLKEEMKDPPPEWLRRQHEEGRQTRITPAQDRIRTFAFQNGCDFDEATLHVLREILNDASLKRTQEGLYDSLFVFPAQQETAQK